LINSDVIIEHAGVFYTHREYRSSLQRLFRVSPLLHREFFRLSLGTPLLLRAITYVDVTMLMKIPRASSYGYLQPCIFFHYHWTW